MFLVLENVDKERESGVQIWTAERDGHIELAVEIPGDDPRVREIIAKNVANCEQVSAAADNKCPKCGIPQSSGDYCDVCLTMINAVRNQPGLREAQASWEQENENRAKAIKKMKESQE